MEEDLLGTAKQFLEKAKAAGVKVVLPRDFVVAPDLDEGSQAKAQHVRCAALRRMRCVNDQNVVTLWR